MMKTRWNKMNWMRRIVGLVLMMQWVCVTGNAIEERAPGISTGFTLGTAGMLDSDFGPGFSGRIFLEYAPFIHEIGVRLTGGYLYFGTTLDIGERPFTSREYVRFDETYGTVGLIYRFARGKYVPYATGNVGVYRYLKEDVEPAAGTVVNGVRLSPFDVTVERSGVDFGLNAGGGLEIFTSERTSLSFDLLVHSIQGDIDERIFDFTCMFRFFPANK